MCPYFCPMKLSLESPEAWFVFCFFVFFQQEIHQHSKESHFKVPYEHCNSATVTSPSKAFHCMLPVLTWRVSLLWLMLIQVYFLLIIKLLCLRLLPILSGDPTLSKEKDMNCPWNKKLLTVHLWNRPQIKSLLRDGSHAGDACFNLPCIVPLTNFVQILWKESEWETARGREKFQIPV